MCKHSSTVSRNPLNNIRITGGRSVAIFRRSGFGDSSGIHLDYKYLDGTARRRPSRLRVPVVLLALAGTVFGFALTFLSVDAEAMRQEPTRLDIVDTLVQPENELQPRVLEIVLPQALVPADEMTAAEMPVLPAASQGQQPIHDTPIETVDANTAEHTWVEHQVQRGDTLSVIFSAVGIGPNELSRILALNGDTRSMSRLQPGQSFRFLLDESGRVQQAIYQPTRLREVHIVRDGDGYRVDKIEHEITGQQRFVTGTIASSLFLAARSSGLSDQTTMNLAQIFGWDVDFALDIRQGDHFSVLYEERLLDGERVGDGPILAAEFTNRGRTYRAVRYLNPEGRAEYFTPDGKSMRRAFLRAPVDFNRISSGFQPERYHPVLGVRRPHRGVDYAAPTGTPIRAAGDGRITVRGRQGGYGNTVVIRHSNGIETLYAHMNGFRRGQSVGSRVGQGDIIGYVGMTGLATGPHLHYEFRVNGAHRNPVTVKLPDADPVPTQLRNDFRTRTAPLLASLEEHMQRAQLARIEVGGDDS